MRLRYSNYKGKGIAGIYKITNIINAKVYIGQSWNIKARFYYHAHRNHNKHFQRAIEKYGLDNFKFEIIHENLESQYELDIAESFYISMYRSWDFKFGYNKTMGGSQGKHTPETLAKLVLASTGNKRALGHLVSVESRKRISEAGKGNTRRKNTIVSVEARAKISLAHKGKPWTQARRDAQERRHIA